MNNSLHRGRFAARQVLDRCANALISAGGVGVILSVVMILVFLLHEVAPLLSAPSLTEQGTSAVPASDSTLLVAEDIGSVGLAFSESGEARFFDLSRDRALLTRSLLYADASVTAATRAALPWGAAALGTEAGELLLVRPEFETTVTQGRRELRPSVRPIVPLLQLAPAGDALLRVALTETDSELAVAAESASGRLYFASWQLDENGLAGSANRVLSLPPGEDPGSSGLLFVDARHRFLVRVTFQGNYTVHDLAPVNNAMPVPRLTSGSLFEAGEQLTAAAVLFGSASFVVASDRGALLQLSPTLQDSGELSLQTLRRFSVPGKAVHHLAADPGSRLFAAVFDDGAIGLFHSTSQRQGWATTGLATDEITASSISNGGGQLLLQDAQGGVTRFSIQAPHADVSARSLFAAVQYEGYRAPIFKWQPATAGATYEAKLSLSPLLWGTLKAAFFTMLFAIPLALSAAIFTGYFMASSMRRKVKPGIELMEAMPTVVLGFLAALWFAPWLDEHLAEALLACLLLPVAVAVSGVLWGLLGNVLRPYVVSGWEPLLLLPVFAGTAALAVFAADLLEQWYLGMSLKDYIYQRWGLDYAQRNALVVGVAMGLAVVPTVFSIAEDALYSVPKQLSDGSLALGASRWQTLRNVVLPTASPGIFSALMIGLGRAVGETMIVVMAAGNTPLMDSNLFSGMRTLSATIALEAPEVALGSSHYRVLIVAALLLFLLTFILNSAAELLRQRLRRRYRAL
ncbi:ABC transporter permease subunit [Halioglobus pacificus]|uniref:Phosphate ABC transporter permease n=1 Tax=Parahalioglobus pacificus TaxID=930806 RepID=A0A918XEJ0_9GAMM|nr:ABC transporter permease subunit [Halioglobus pacificus]GHD29030.1 phosphate ABC transporter permease [Halioglobus pacificus]